MFYFIFWYQIIKILHMGILVLHKWFKTGKMCIIKWILWMWSFLILRSAKMASYTFHFSKSRSFTTPSPKKTSTLVCRCMEYWIWKGWILPHFSNFTIAPHIRAPIQIPSALGSLWFEGRRIKSTLEQGKPFRVFFEIISITGILI